MLTFVLWALAFASAAFWGLRLSGPASGAPYPPAAAPTAAPPDAGALGRALGAVTEVADTPVAAPASSRFSLVGVLAGSSRSGAALIAVDGQPAKTFRVGTEVVPGFRLQSVAPRRVVLGAEEGAPASSGSGLTVEMAPLGGGQN